MPPSPLTHGLPCFRFRGEAGALLLQRGGALVIRRLCGHLGAEKVFTELALILHQEEDLGFASTLVQALNLILLTSPEVCVCGGGIDGLNGWVLRGVTVRC